MSTSFAKAPFEADVPGKPRRTTERKGKEKQEEGRSGGKGGGEKEGGRRGVREENENGGRRKGKGGRGRKGGGEEEEREGEREGRERYLFYVMCIMYLLGRGEDSGTCFSLPRGPRRGEEEPTAGRRPGKNGGGEKNIKKRRP